MQEGRDDSAIMGDAGPSNQRTRLRVAGAWSGSLEVLLDAWTVEQLRAELSSHSGIVLNSIKGENGFTRKELDSIADGLSSTEAGSSVPNPLSLIYKPHRNVVTGNYDANVLISALDSREKDVVWFDRRKGIDDLLSEIAEYGDDRLLGMIVNFSTKKLLGLWQGRHWVAVRKVQGMWYNLDSDRVAPICFGNGDDALRDYLNSVISTDGVVIFVLNKPTDEQT